MEPIAPILHAPVNSANLDRFHDARAEGAFKDLEALFINELLKEMRKSIPDDGLFEKNHEREIYEGMLDSVFSEAMAESGQFGIAKQIAEQVRIQEIQRAVRPSIDLERLELKKSDETADKNLTALNVRPGRGT